MTLVKKRKHNQQYVITVLLIAFATLNLSAQMELKSLFVDKQFDNSYKTTLTFRMPIEAGKEFHSMDKDNMKFTVLKDDTGKDFLVTGNGILLNESYFSAYNDYDRGNIFDLRLVIDGVPAMGAKTLEIQGELPMQYQGGDEQELELTLQMPGKNYEGVTDTEAGKVIINQAGSATMGDVLYQYFSFTADLPIKSFEVLGPSDTEELRTKGIGVDDDQFVFKEQPAQIKVKFQFADIQEEKMPLDLKVGIGF